VGNYVWKHHDQLLQTSDSLQNSTPSTTSIPIPQSPSSELPDYPAAIPVPEFIPHADQDPLSLVFLILRNYLPDIIHKGLDIHLTAIRTQICAHEIRKGGKL